MLQFWIKDQFYFSNEKDETIEIGKASRYYAFSDNHLVYDSDGQSAELYKHSLEKVLYAISPSKDCEHVFNYFMIYRKNLYDTKNFDLFQNGEIVSKGIPSYLQLWMVTNNFHFDKNPKIVGYPGTNLLPLEKFMPNTRIFEKLVDLAKKQIKIPPNLNAHKLTIQGGISRLKQQIEEQISENKIKMETDKDRDYRTFPYVTLSLPDLFSRREYSEPAIVKEQNKHIGQRKLLISEIDFFLQLQCFSIPSLVLYAGAAPGQHIAILSDMFPLTRFVLFDPAFGESKHPDSTKGSCKEHGEIKPDGKIMVRSQLFDESVIAEFSREMEMLLISDIRTTPQIDESDPDYDYQFEERTDADMKLQQNWTKQLSLRGALLKFRLRHASLVKSQDDDLKTMYLSGLLRLQTWAKPFSSERRLIVFPSHNYPDVEYDNKKEDEMMSSFNIEYRTRPFFHNHPLFGVNYDTQTEYTILNAWLQVSGFREEDVNAILLIAIIDCALGRGIGQYIIPSIFKTLKQPKKIILRDIVAEKRIIPQPIVKRVIKNKDDPFQ